MKKWVTWVMAAVLVVAVIVGIVQTSRLSGARQAAAEQIEALTTSAEAAQSLIRHAGREDAGSGGGERSLVR